MHSAYAPERLAVELQSRVGPSLSQRGYRLVAQGPAGVAWRREMSAKLIAGIIVLGLFALGGLASGQAGSIVLGLACAVAAALLVYFKRSANVTIGFARTPDGTDITVSGGRDAAKAEALVRPFATVTSSAPAPSPALAEPMAGMVQAAELRRRRIAEAIERTEMPFDEVTEEVDGFVAAIDRAARRAQLLHEALADTPRADVVARLEAARRDPERAALVQALEDQDRALARMERQLADFRAEVDRLLVELDTVRTHLVLASTSGDALEQRRLAGDVRGLRERMGTLADGMAAAYGRSPV